MSMFLKTMFAVAAVAVGLFSAGFDARGAEPGQPAGGGDNASELAKAAQNPIAAMISLPLQLNIYFDTGEDNLEQTVLLVQPVYPMKINDDWNLIARPIIPLVDMPPVNSALDRESGLGNIQFQGFFSPRDPVGGWIVGFGPYLEFPTNTDDMLGSDNWSAGPAFVALQMKGAWVYGALVSQLWSYAGPDPAVNLTSFQPFINYNLPGGWYLSTSPVITNNWSADSDDQLTLPVGGGIGKVFRIGRQPVNASLKAYHMIEAPANGPEWQLQFQVQFLFPKQ